MPLRLGTRRSSSHGTTTFSFDSNIDTGGGTDATATIQAAIDAAAEAGGGDVLINGVARIDGAVGLIIKSGVALVGVGEGAGLWRSNDTDNTTGGKPVIRTLREADPAITTRRIRIENLTLNCNGILTGGDYNETGRYEDPKVKLFLLGLWFQNADDVVMRRVTVRNARTFATVWANVTSSLVEDCTFVWDKFWSHENGDCIHHWGCQNQVIRNLRCINGSDDVLSFVTGEVADFAVQDYPFLAGVGGDSANILVEGLVAENCCQIIRFASQNGHMVRDVTIRNVTAHVNGLSFSSTPFLEQGYFLTSFSIGPNVTLENLNLTGRCRFLWHDTAWRNLSLRNVTVEYGLTALSIETIPLMQWFGAILGADAVTIEGLHFTRPAAHTTTAGSLFSFTPLVSVKLSIDSFRVNRITARGVVTMLVAGEFTPPPIGRLEVGNGIDLGGGLLLSGTVAAIIGNSARAIAEQDADAIAARLIEAGALTSLADTAEQKHLTIWFDHLYRTFGRGNVQTWVSRSAYNAGSGATLYGPRVDLTGNAPAWNPGGAAWGSHESVKGDSGLVVGGDPLCVVLLLQRPAEISAGGMSCVLQLGDLAGVAGDFVSFHCKAAHPEIMAVGNGTGDSAGVAISSVPAGNYFVIAFNLNGPAGHSSSLNGGPFGPPDLVATINLTRPTVAVGSGGAGGFASTNCHWGANVSAVTIIRGTMNDAQSAGIYAAAKVSIGTGLSLP